jgi:hypothetical protein
MLTLGISTEARKKCRVVRGEEVERSEVHSLHHPGLARLAVSESNQTMRQYDYRKIGAVKS